MLFSYDSESSVATAAIIESKKYDISTSQCGAGKLVSAVPRNGRYSHRS